MANQKTANESLAEKINHESLEVYVRTRIGRYLAINNTFDFDIEKAKTYRSISSCIGAIKQMTPELQRQLMKRGVSLEIIKTGSIELPSTAFSKATMRVSD